MWTKTAVVVCLLIARAGAVLAQARPEQRGPVVLVNVDHRRTTTLNGDWHTIVDPYATGLFGFHGTLRKDGYFLNQRKEGPGGPLEYDFQKSPTLRVPGDWNTQRESMFLYEGVVWYQKDFDYQLRAGHRLFSHVGAANYRSYVWINGKKACEHEGGFTAFDCEITDLVRQGRNFAVVAVDSTRLPDGAPTTQTDWWNYGGLTRDVSLVEVPKAFIDDYSLQLKRGTRTEIEGWVHVDGAEPGTAITVSIPEQRVSQTNKVEADGRAKFQLHAASIELWSPENPKLHKLQISAGDDTLEDEIGFRTIEVRGTRILLNGKPMFLRGISVHAEAPYRTGRAYTDEDAKTLLGWVQELGGNFARLAHYPHDERMTRWADRMGVLIWSEIPVYWACQFENPTVLAKAKQQLEEMIRRDRNKASVILWSVANETPAGTARTQFLETLVTRTRELDPSRLVTAALLVWDEAGKKTVADPLGKSLDVIGINEYIGWYEKTPEAADRTDWDVRYDKPVIVSEFGGDAKFGLHGDDSKRWTEEYQANIYEHQLAMINRIPQVRGLSPWILMDFRSPRRPLPGVQDFFNRKGLLSEKGEKKKAFFILQKAYKERSVGKAE